MGLKRWWIGLLALVALAGLIWGWQRPLAVTAVHPARGPVVEAAYASGQVEPGVQMPIAPRSGAHVTAVLAKEGDRVRRGQVLVQLEDADLANGEAELKAKLALSERQYARTSDLVKHGFLSPAELDRVRSERDAAQASLSRGISQRTFLQLRAPADGEILRRDVEVGQFVPAGQAIMFMACCEPLRVVADVDEEDIRRVQVGQEVLLRVDALPGEVHTGRVSQITPKGDPVSRSYRVRIALDQPQPFKVGMTVEANVVMARREDGLTLPRAAVSGGAVWRVVDGRAQRQAVQTGVSAGERVEIRNGVTPDDLVVTSPPDGLREGQRVSLRATP